MNSSRPKSVIVMDRATAKWLADQLDAQIAKLSGTDLARSDRRKSPRAAKSDAQRTAEFRNRRRSDSLDGLYRVNRIGSNGNPSIPIRIPVTPNLAHVGSFFADKYAKRALFESNGITTDGLVALLREQHERVCS